MECFKCKSAVTGESGIQCAGVCGKMFHLKVACSGLDRYSSSVLDTTTMLKFICDDCVMYIHNVDLAVREVQETVQKNGNYLKQYKNEFEESLKKNELEIKNLLEAIEARYTDRLRAMKIAQDTCEKSVKEIKKISNYSESFKTQSDKICEDVKKNRKWIYKYNSKC